MPQPTVAPGTEIRERERIVPLYRVVLLDDNDHTYDYVIEMLQKLFVFSLQQAFHHAQEVDSVGRTILITCELPQAEFGRDQIHAYGPDPRLSRSKPQLKAVKNPRIGSSHERRRRSASWGLSNSAHMAGESVNDTRSEITVAPAMVRAKVPWRSSQARTHREQTMHLAGSYTK